MRKAIPYPLQRSLQINVRSEEPWTKRMKWRNSIYGIKCYFHENVFSGISFLFSKIYSEVVFLHLTPSLNSSNFELLYQKSTMFDNGQVKHSEHTNFRCSRIQLKWWQYIKTPRNWPTYWPSWMLQRNSSLLGFWYFTANLNTHCHIWHLEFPTLNFKASCYIVSSHISGGSCR